MTKQTHEPVIFIVDGFIDNVIDIDTFEEMGYIKIDSGSWEIGHCPVCYEEDIVTVGLEQAITKETRTMVTIRHYDKRGYISKIDRPKKPIIEHDTVEIGGHKKCCACGAEEGMEYKELIKCWLKYEEEQEKKDE